MATKKATKSAKKAQPKKATAKRSLRTALDGPAMAPSSVLLVNIIPRSMSHENSHDSEPNLAVNPSNPQQMAASAFTPNPAGTGNAPIFLSNDGGRTWMVQTIVPSLRMTGDICMRFGGANTLYAGILRTPFTQFDNRGNPIPRLNILRTNNAFSGALMNVVVDRTGHGVDQPYVETTKIASGPQAGRDVVVVGNNDFNNANGRTANLDLSRNGAASAPGFSKVAIDSRDSGGGTDAPSIRPAIHSDGTVYAAFLHQVGGTALNNLTYDIVVVRDDAFGGGSFRALTDPSDSHAGRRVAQNRLIPFLPDNRGDPGPLGQERIGSHLAICVDPRLGHSATVYVAWADRVGVNDYTIHLRKSDDRGVTWSADLSTITNAVNPALAINSDGVVGFLYQQLTGDFTPGIVSQVNRWETCLERSTDSGATFTKMILATVPAKTPAARGLPYLGDYINMQAVGRDFCGIFSANNQPDLTHFPQGVIYQRNCDFPTRRLFDMDNQTVVDVSIDPFFFRVSG